jgi:malate dehydrogenase (decarboxylating)
MATLSRNIRRSLAADRLRRILSPGTHGYITAECHSPVVLHKRGPDILHDPWYNRVRASVIPARMRV